MLKKILINFRESITESNSHFMFFGCFGIVNYALPYFMWDINKPDDLVFLWIRIIASILCFTLIIKDAWAGILKKIFPVFWIFTAGFCLPFFSTFMLLKTQANIVWIINVSLSTFLLAFLVNWVNFIFLVFSGSISAFFLSYYLYGQKILVLENDVAYLLFYIYAFSISICLLFLREKEKLIQNRIDFMRLISGKMAHELRTPLSSIGMNVQTIKSIVSKEHPSRNIENIKGITSQLEFLTCKSQKIIDLMLMKINEKEIIKSERIHVSKAIIQALKDYPLTESEKSCIKTHLTADFVVQGNKLLFSHIIFNLLKNALYAIKKKPKGMITIKTISKNGKNQIFFSDTGCGINLKELPYIFDKFYSKIPKGTGLGLSFVKMVTEDFGGKIYYAQIPEQTTTFCIEFPKKEAI